MISSEVGKEVIKKELPLMPKLPGVYRMLNYKGDIPYKVVINECIELAKYFGASESFKYINSVLDSLSKTLRPTEYATR